MACAKRSENHTHQPLGQVREDREDNSATVDQDYASELTVTRELSNWHGSSDRGVQTRASTAKETARASKDFLIKKSSKPPTTEPSRVEEEPNEWENEYMPLLMNTSQNQTKYQDENVSSKTKKATKIRRDSDEESSQSGLSSYHTSPSQSSSSVSEGDIIEYDAISPSQPRTSGIVQVKALI